MLERKALPISYNYHLPHEEQFRLWEESKEWLPSDMGQNPLIRSSFFWALRHGDHKTKLQVIQAFGRIADREVEEALQAFLLDPDEDEYLKDMALFVLRNMGVTKQIAVTSEGSTTMVDPSKMTTKLPVWKSEWQSVVDLVLTNMSNNFDLRQQYDLETLWVDFLTRLYPDTPSISHIEGWAAALEYLTAKIHHLSVSYDEVANRYGISATTVRRYVCRVDEVCGVKAKIQAIFPSVQ